MSKRRIWGGKNWNCVQCGVERSVPLRKRTSCREMHTVVYYHHHFYQDPKFTPDPIDTDDGDEKSYEAKTYPKLLLSNNMCLEGSPSLVHCKSADLLAPLCGNCTRESSVDVFRERCEYTWKERRRSISITFSWLCLFLQHKPLKIWA